MAKLELIITREDLIDEYNDLPLRDINCLCISEAKIEADLGLPMNSNIVFKASRITIIDHKVQNYQVLKET